MIKSMAIFLSLHSMLTNHLQMTSGTHLSLAEAKTFFLESFFFNVEQ